MFKHLRHAYFLYSTIVGFLLFTTILPADGQITGGVKAETLRNVTTPVEVTLREDQVSHKSAVTPEWETKIDPSLRSILRQSTQFQKSGIFQEPESSSFPLSFSTNEYGEPVIEIFIKTDGSQNLNLHGIDVLAQVGDIFAVRVPVSSLETLARSQSISFIEASMRRSSLNDAGRLDIGAHHVHQGTNLPAQYRGEGVIVGVVDSGIDFTHPDFSNDNGTRIQYLVEYTENGVVDWTKAQIDANPQSVTQRDLDDGFGHGTHVTGSAAGGGRINTEMRGVAPASDIIFAKAFIGGGFSDAHVVSACQYIFNKADQHNKPAVVNLSLGGMFGPLDGSSAYEQALSGLTGPGRIIVTAAGNQGFDLIHAGGQLPANRRNATILLTNNDEEAAANIWYTPGVVSQIAVAAFYVDENGTLQYLANTDFVPPGTFLNYPPLEFEEDTLGYIGIDALTTNDPRNGDGNIVVHLLGDPDNGVYLSNIVWVIFYDTNNAGQLDMWSFGGEFWPSQVGFEGVNEVVGNTSLTVGSPSTAKKVIAVGSYVTKNTWIDIDGSQRQWLNPNPDRSLNTPVVPAIGQKSYFSSIGPTRDGRIAPQISAPGEYIFSPISSHLNEGQGFQRHEVLQGGHYRGMQGTSMASPHVTGLVALLLQIDPTLTYEGVLEILESTARSDSHTGSLPNNFFGSGKVDAFEAVKSIAGEPTGPGEPTVLRYFDPQSEQRTFTLDRILPIDSGFVYGTNRFFDQAKATVFTLPAGQSQGEISQVKVWFGYRKDGLTDEKYNIVVYNGSSENGPQGQPIASREYMLKDVNADATFGNRREATVHTFSEPISVGSSFFVGVDFGSYGDEGIGNAGIVSTPLLGSRVPQEWEQWDNGAWHNISDAWFGNQSAAGTGTDGANLWIEVTLGGTTSIPGDDLTLPTTLALEQNYPNPFNPVTVIQYALPEAGHVSLIVYDMLGREVQRLVDGEMNAGIHRINFEAGSLSSGVYMYQLRAGDQVRTKRLLLLK